LLQLPKLKGCLWDAVEEQLGPRRLESSVQLVKLFRLKVRGEVAKRHEPYSSFRGERGAHLSARGLLWQLACV
jgi:hypothetical protein